MGTSLAQLGSKDLAGSVEIRNKLKDQSKNQQEVRPVTSLANEAWEFVQGSDDLRGTQLTPIKKITRRQKLCDFRTMFVGTCSSVFKGTSD